MNDGSENAIKEFIQYNNWANLQVLQACQKLSEEQLDTKVPGTYGTLRELLQHILSGETYYTSILTGSRPQPPFKWEDRPSLAEMADFAKEVGEVLLDTAERVLPGDLVVEEDEGKRYRYKAMAIYIQIINHGIEHRTNITTQLSLEKLAPPQVDGWGYLNAHTVRFALNEL